MAVWCLLLPLLAGASGLPYAKRWPLVLAATGEGAYRVVLTPEVYATAIGSDLRDVDVVDARGTPVAAALLGPEQPLAQPARQVAVPWFPLPATAAGEASALRLSARFDDQGRILQLDANAATAQPRQLEANQGFLVDLSSLREGIDGLRIDWTPGSPREAAYRVDASDDLQAWEPLRSRVVLVELRQDGRHLVQNALDLATTRRYLRFTPLEDVPALPVLAVQARLPERYAVPARNWVELNGRPVTRKGVEAIEFVSDGRYPVTTVALASGDNAVGEWTLESRDADDAPWRYRAGPWVAWQVGGQRPAASPVQTISGAPVRDRQWRLRPSGALPAQPPRLRLGYQPEVLVFLAQGTSPYALVAGSGTATRAQAPLAQMIEALRAQRGQDWKPAPAYLGASAVLAGPSALIKPAPPRDWKTWLLWGLLAGGALLVAGFAVSLLRQPKPAA